MRNLTVGLCLWLTCQCHVVAEPVSVYEPAPIDVNGVRIWSAPDHTQVVFDASGPVWHKILVLKNPDRLAIDLLGGRVESLWTHGVAGGFVKGVTTGVTREGLSLITLDLKQGVFPSSFNLKPKWHYGHRLVIDLSDAEKISGSNTVKVANLDKRMNAYFNPRWQHAYRLVVDQSPREETANIFRMANADTDIYSMSRLINDGIKGGIAGGMLGWLLVLMRAGCKYARK